MKPFSTFKWIRLTERGHILCTNPKTLCICFVLNNELFISKCLIEIWAIEVILIFN